MKGAAAFNPNKEKQPIEIIKFQTQNFDHKISL